MRNTWAHKDVIIRERISFRTLSATHARHGRVRDLHACGGSNQQAEKHRRSQQHRQRADKHRCCLTAHVGQLYLSMGARHHSGNELRNIGILTRHAVLNHWRPQRHQQRAEKHRCCHPACFACSFTHLLAPRGGEYSKGQQQQLQLQQQQ